MIVTESLHNRFFDKVEKRQGCWLWKAALRGKTGYGCMKVEGRVEDAHRISWMIFNGVHPLSDWVTHTCDNRLCVNLNHLVLKTRSQTMKDCFEKGTVNPPRSR